MSTPHHFVNLTTIFSMRKGGGVHFSKLKNANQTFPMEIHSRYIISPFSKCYFISGWFEDPVNLGFINELGLRRASLISLGLILETLIIFLTIESNNIDNYIVTLNKEWREQHSQFLLSGLLKERWVSYIFIILWFISNIHLTITYEHVWSGLSHI